MNFSSGNRRGAEKGETTRAKSDDFAHQLYYQESDFQVADRVGEIADKHRANLAQVALAWMLAKPGITAPIIGATKGHHVDDAAKLEELYQPRPVLGMF